MYKWPDYNSMILVIIRLLRVAKSPYSKPEFKKKTANLKEILIKYKTSKSIFWKKNQISKRYHKTDALLK